MIKLATQPNPDEPVPAGAGAPEPFDVNKLRLDQSFTESAGVKKLLTTVPVRKPGKQDFIRVHPSPDYRATLGLIELHDERETYLLTPDIARALPGEYALATLYTTVNRAGVVHLWPVKLPAPDGKVTEWHRSAAEAAEMAMSKWIRVKPNMQLGAYEIYASAGVIPDPEWPSLSFN